MVKQGDIIYVDFDPTLGHEQKGNRPAVVISNNTFNTKTSGLIIILPITHTIRSGFPLHVDLDSRTKIQGQILCEQLKTIDTQARVVKKVEKLPDDLLDRVIKIVKLEF